MDSFEDLIFEGVLQIIFEHLYALPISVRIFYSGYVNKRWNKVFDHPLKVFDQGRYNLNLKKFPPNFYATREHKKFMQKFCIRGGMIKQLELIEDLDKEREEFLIQEILAHYFVIPQSIKNKKIKEIVVDILIAISESRSYWPVNLFVNSALQMMEVVPEIDVTSVLKWLRVWHKTIGDGDLRVISDGLILKDHSLFTLLIEEGFASLDAIPDEWKTEEVCIKAIIKDPRAIEWIPDHLKTEYICDLSLDRFGLCFKQVPQHLKTEQRCKVAVHKSGYALKYVPESINSFDICMIAVSNSGPALEFVPINLMTQELCKAAINQAPFSIRWVPDHLRTPDLLKFVVLRSWPGFSRIRNHERSFELCHIAVSTYGSIVLNYIPWALLTDDLTSLAHKTTYNI